MWASVSPSLCFISKLTVNIWTSTTVAVHDILSQNLYDVAHTSSDHVYLTIIVILSDKSRRNRLFLYDSKIHNICQENFLQPAKYALLSSNRVHERTKNNNRSAEMIHSSFYFVNL